MRQQGARLQGSTSVVQRCKAGCCRLTCCLRRAEQRLAGSCCQACSVGAPKCMRLHIRSSSEFHEALLGMFCSVSENARCESMSYAGRGNCMRAQAK